jgi:chromosome segregation protein
MSMPGIVPIADVLRISGPHVATIQKVVPEAYIADTFEQAVTMSRQTSAPVATIEGDLFRGPHLVSGGLRVESRGILATRREIKDLHERIAAERTDAARLAEEGSRLDAIIAEVSAALAGLTAEQHRQEVAIVGQEAQLARAVEESTRLARKGDLISLELRQADDERVTLDARYAEAETSIARLFEEQRIAEADLSSAQGRLMTAREAVEERSARVAESRATHATMIERAAALAAEVLRLEEAARDIETRVTARAAELDQARTRREGLLAAIADATTALDVDIQALDALRDEVRAADEAAAEIRVKVDAQDSLIREARRRLEEIRGQAGELHIARATAESDLGHLSQLCVETLQCSLDEVLADVERMELAGEATPDAAAITADDPDPDAEDEDSGVEAGFPGPLTIAGAGSRPDPVESAYTAARTGVMTAEEAITTLKAKIDRLGPVNMMAIEQFDELETRHVFLTTQRKDLTDSIAQTAEAIKRIDETSTARFQEAFTAIQQNFQETFSTLFGGGRAGLTLLDENDPLESGIDIVASPPGKRLQNVQLLSGGEKALTAISLMFAIFKYKPSPFCLLDEIDAPLDDANVGRFVDMLRGMLDRTQFILITHNRRTMEIANRLYGVTMEEPGVSKLISVQLN